MRQWIDLVTQFYKFAEKINCSQRNEKFIQLILSKSKREESKTEMATLEYRRVSYLRYYNITPTFILEVKLRISAWITHNVSPCSSCCIFFPLLLRANFVSFSLYRTCSLTHNLLLSCHACSSFCSVLSEGRSNGPPLSQNPLLGFSSFLRARTPELASRDQTLSATKHMKLQRSG